MPTNSQLNGEFKRRVKDAYDLLSGCHACAWHCPADRRAGKLGVCKTGVRARVSSYGPHMGEEEPLRGWRGSGTIFFSRCNLKCQYCQNYDISQRDAGQEVEPEDLAVIMLELQAMGCHNINFVSPSHVAPQIMAGVLIAAQAGLRLPLVYNTGGYDSLEMLRLLDGVIDIYMPDMKYADPAIARRYSKIRDYPQANQAAGREMHRQVGDLQVDEQGLARRGLFVRHRVLPNDLARHPDDPALPGRRDLAQHLPQPDGPVSAGVQGPPLPGLQPPPGPPGVSGGAGDGRGGGAA